MFPYSTCTHTRARLLSLSLFMCIWTLTNTTLHMCMYPTVYSFVRSFHIAASQPLDSILPEDKERRKQRISVPLEITCDDSSLSSLPDESLQTPTRDQMSCNGDSPLFTLLMYQRWDAARKMLSHSPQLVSEWTYGTESNEEDDISIIYNNNNNKSGTTHDSDDKAATLWKRLPIHHACRFGAPLSLLQQMVDLAPDTVRAKDPCQGLLPLHLACRYRCSTRVVTFLLEHYPRAAREADTSGRLPLHFACLRAVSSTVVYKLVQAYPASVCVRDKSGKPPLEYTTVETGIDTETLALLDKLRRFLTRVEKRKKVERKSTKGETERKTSITTKLKELENDGEASGVVA